MDHKHQSKNNQSDLLKDALGYVRRGWSIIPIAQGTKKPPKGFRWTKFQTRPASESEIRDWFDCRDDLGLAVVLGKVSGGLVCRDFDDRQSYRRWKRDHPDLAASLPTVKTAHCYHVYFHAGPAHQVFCDLHPAEEGEYRGDSKHYCLLPPSRHPDGTVYKWIVPLPKGEVVPFIDEVVAAGLLPSEDVTQKAQGNTKKLQVVSRGVAHKGKSVRVSQSTKDLIEEAIDSSLPTGPGMRGKKLLEIARKLKFSPEFHDIPTTGIEFLKPHLKRWWRRAESKTSGKHPHFWQNWQDFVFAWEEARIPYGETMRGIFDKACMLPPPSLAAEKYGEGSLRTLLASLCRELQQFNGGGTFYLSGRTAGELLGVSGVQAWRWLKQLSADGIVDTVKTYPRGKRLATEYRYLDLLANRQAADVE